MLANYALQSAPMDTLAMNRFASVRGMINGAVACLPLHRHRLQSESLHGTRQQVQPVRADSRDAFGGS